MSGKFLWHAVAASFLAAGQILASTFAGPVDLRDLAQRADGAYLATVTAVTPRLVGQDALESAVDLRVEDRLFGGAAPGAVLTVVHAGGELGERVERLSSAPSFSVGERVLVFVSARPDGALAVLDEAQGKLVVIQDPSSGRDLLRANGSFSAPWPEDPGDTTSPHPRAPDLLPLSEVLKQLAGRPGP